VSETGENNTTLIIVVDGSRYPVDLAKVTLGDYKSIRRITDGACFNFPTLAAAIENQDPAGLAALTYVAMAHTNPNVTEDYVLSLTAQQIGVENPEETAGVTPTAPVEQDDVGGKVLELHNPQTVATFGGPSTDGSTVSARGSSSG
jgi:hypothetical protein